LGDLSQVVTGSDQRQLGSGLGPDLAEADRSGKAVADTFAAPRFHRVAAFAEEIGQRLGGTTVADRAIGLAVGMAQVTEVADPAGEASGSVKTLAWPRRLRRMASRLSWGWTPDSSQKANAVPTCTPVAPKRRASAIRPGRP
jgi:hypothetical protein